MPLKQRVNGNETLSKNDMSARGCVAVGRCGSVRHVSAGGRTQCRGFDLFFGVFFVSYGSSSGWWSADLRVKMAVFALVGGGRFFCRFWGLV